MIHGVLVEQDCRYCDGKGTRKISGTTESCRRCLGRGRVMSAIPIAEFIEKLGLEKRSPK